MIGAPPRPAPSSVPRLLCFPPGFNCCLRGGVDKTNTPICLSGQKDGLGGFVAFLYVGMYFRERTRARALAFLLCACARARERPGAEGRKGEREREDYFFFRFCFFVFIFCSLCFAHGGDGLNGDVVGGVEKGFFLCVCCGDQKLCNRESRLFVQRKKGFGGVEEGEKREKAVDEWVMRSNDRPASLG